MRAAPPISGWAPYGDDRTSVRDREELDSLPRGRKKLRTCRSLFERFRGLGLAYRVRHAVEGRGQIRADQLNGGDDHDGDSRSDQAVLDGGRTGIIPHKTAKQA